MSTDLPDLGPARGALTQLATDGALEHLHAARENLAALTSSLLAGPPLKPADQRSLERALLRFQSDLKAARALADQGLAFCHDWADQLEPPPTYQPNGARAAIRSHSELSLQA